MNDAWDHIVGIPIEDWVRADTPTQIGWLIWLRDNPMPQPPTRVVANIYAFGGTLIRTIREPA